jgi:GTP-binding protein HflX
VVENTIAELGAAPKKILKVFNKIDELETRQIKGLQRAWPEAVFIAAERGIGLEQLQESCRTLIEDDFVNLTLQIPLDKYEAVAFLHRTAAIYAKKYVNSHVEVSFRISEENILRLKKMLPNLEEKITI